jgi:hypothetical protein
VRLTTHMAPATGPDDRTGGRRALRAPRALGRLARNGRARSLARIVATATCATAGLLATSAVAHADAPGNDNYVASTPILTRQYHQTIDTTQAGEQANLFEPAAPGKPAGGNMPEPLTCNGQAYGKTVWFDFLPPTAGGVRIVASGFDTVVALYEYDPKTASIVRSLGCQDASKGPTEEFDVPAPKIQKGHYYTVQVGGAVVGGAAQGGALDFALQFYGDRDSDSVLDPNDLCPDAPGTRAGCPPQIPGTPSMTITGGRISVLEWSGLPRGTEVTADCRGCGRRGVRQTVRVPNGGAARLRAFAGVPVRRGAVLKVVARSRAAGSATSPFAAIGKSARYRFGSGSLRWDTGCLVPGSTKEQMACPR